MRNSRFPATIVAGLMAVGVFACGGDDGPSAILTWVEEPPGNVERGEVISASWTIETDAEIAASGILACSGAVPDCGLGGQDAVGYQAAATLGDDGVWTASLVVTEQGNWTVVAYAFADADFISPPKGVVVDKLAYPGAPYGYGIGAIIEDFSLEGYIDDDGDGDLFNEAARQIALNEFFQGEDLDAKIILINVGAGWCPYCQDEMRYLTGVYDSYYAKGARVYSVVVQDDSENTADLAFAQTWANRFGSKMPITIDPTDLLGPYYPEAALPLNVYINAETMQIVDSYVGFSQESTAQIFDYYVNL